MQARRSDMTSWKMCMHHWYQIILAQYGETGYRRKNCQRLAMSSQELIGSVIG